MRRISRAINRWWVFWPALLLYVGLWLLPASIWFSSAGQLVSDARPGAAPVVVEDRTIRISFVGDYSTSTREVDSNEIAAGCTASAQVRYRGGLSGVRSMTLVDWTDGKPGCGRLPPGTYYTETCRTVLRPLWGLLPAKEECWVSNLFRIGGEG